MLDIESIIERLSDRNLSEVARRCDIDAGLVWRIYNKKTDNPGYLAVKRLSDYFMGDING